MENLTIENIDNKIVEISKIYEKAMKEKKDYSKKIPQISAAFIDSVKQYHEIKTQFLFIRGRKIAFFDQLSCRNNNDRQ